MDSVELAFAASGTLADAVRVGLGLSPEWLVVGVIVQDEYTHDVIFASATGVRAVVLDCT